MLPGVLNALYNRSISTVEIEFRHIGATVRQGMGRPPLTILSDVSGTIRPSEIIAIVGPSGAGKSSLLSVLRGRRRISVWHEHEYSIPIVIDFLHRYVGLLAQFTKLVDTEGWSRRYMQEGTLLCNGARYNTKRMRKLVGYVPQSDTMHRDMTGMFSASRHPQLTVSFDQTTCGLCVLTRQCILPPS